MSEESRARAPFPAPEGPFRFLHYFQEGDAAFAGREGETRDVVAGILRSRTLVIYGRSGLGKTSLLLAGVFPALRVRGLSPVYVRVFDEPIDDLRAALADAFPEAGPAPAEGGMEHLASRPAAVVRPGTPVLVLDQLEELFIRFRDRREVLSRFVETLVELLSDTRLDLRVVFSLREDYLAELDDFRSRLPDLFANEYRLHALSAFGARQAISRALQLAGIEYEQRLLTGLVDELAKDRYDPAILQILGSELARAAAAGRNGRPLAAADLPQGGVAGIFERTWKNLREELRSHPNRGLLLLVLVILERLVTEERTKQAVTVDSLCRGFFRTTPEEVEQGLEVLIRHRLVRPLVRGKVTRYELIHDRLVEYVERWLRQDVSFLGLRNARNRVAAIVLDGGFLDDPDLLLTPGQLKNLVGPHKERLRFSEAELEALLCSAIFHHSTDLPYWANRYGATRSPGLIFKLLRSPHTETRRGAAEAVGHLATATAELADLCLSLALGDADEDVRRAAGRSLSRWVDAEHEAELSLRLLTRRTRGAVLEILADFLEEDRLPPSFAWYWRLWAWRIVRERKLARNRDMIHRRGQLGAIVGAITGVAYLPGLLVSPLWWALLPGGSRSTEVGFTVSVSLCLTALLGSLLGWRVAVSSAKLAACGGEGRWLRSVLQSAWHLLVLLPFVWRAWAEWLDVGPYQLLSDPFLVLGLILAVGGIHLLIAAPFGLARLVLAPAEGRVRLWLTIWVFTLGVPALLPMLPLVLITFYTNPLLGEEFFLLLLGLVWNFVSFNGVVVLSHVERKPALLLGPVPVPSRRSRRRAGGLVVVFFLATLGLTGWIERGNLSAARESTTPWLDGLRRRSGG